MNIFSGDSNCKALWRFENGALTTDSRGTNTLSTSGTPVADTGDYKEGGGCADLESTNLDYFYITDASLDAGFPLKSGDTNKKISVCFWFKPESLVANAYMISKYVTPTNKRSFAITQGGSGEVLIIIGYSSGTLFEFHNTTNFLTAGRWHHIGVTFQDSDGAYRIRVWDDTASSLLEDASGNFTNKISITDAPFHVFSRGNPDAYSDGRIDELVVFDDILTVSEIDAIRNGRYPKPMSALINHYRQTGSM